MMALSEKQRKFTLLVSRLIQWAYEMGYELSFGEALRTPEQQAIYFKTGKSKTLNSKHLEKLAIDLNLFKDGEYQADSLSHRPLGGYWKSLDPECKWGGDFKFGDGNHYQFGE